MTTGLTWTTTDLRTGHRETSVVREVRGPWFELLVKVESTPHDLYPLRIGRDKMTVKDYVIDANPHRMGWYVGRNDPIEEFGIPRQIRSWSEWAREVKITV